MKIAYCTAIFPRWSERFLLRELSYLRSRGIEVVVWALERSPDAGENRVVINGLQVKYRPARISTAAVRSLGWLCAHHPVRLMVLLWEVSRLAVDSPFFAVKLLANLHAVAYFAREARVSGVSAVHGCFLNLPGLVAMGVSILTGLSFTVAGHGRDAFVENSAARSLARRARWIVLCHASAAEALVGRLDRTLRSKLVVLHHGLEPASDADSTDAETGRASGDPLIVAAGRFVPKKGFDVLLRAVADARACGARVQLALAGEGPQADLLRVLCGELGLNDSVTWPGWLSEPALRRLLSRAAAVVVPSVVDADGDRDGIPNVVLEAWSLRVPVVASALPGLREAICHEAHGLLVPPGDARQLASAIQRLLGDCVLRRRLTDLGWQRLRAKFDPEANGQRLLSLLAKGHHEWA